MPPNPNYEERDDGFWKKDRSVTRGNAGFFSRPAPPMRDGGGRPVHADGSIDMQTWDGEVQEAGGLKGWLERIRSIYGG